MAIEVNGKFYRTLADEFFVNGAKVYQAFANGVQVYPDGGIPDHIKIVTPPNKTAYFTSDHIDYTGMVVVVYDEFDNPCSDIYPNGVIPHEDLILKDVIAGDVLYMVEARGPFPYDTRMDLPIRGYRKVAFSCWLGWESNWRRYVFGVHDPDTVIIPYAYDLSRGEGEGLYINLRVYSKHEGTVARWSEDGVDGVGQIVHDEGLYTTEGEPYIFDGKPVYRAPGLSGISANGSTPYDCYPNDKLSDDGNKFNGASDAWLVLYGGSSYNGVPVKWQRPQDGTILSDSFDIIIGA